MIVLMHASFYFMFLKLQIRIFDAQGKMLQQQINTVEASTYQQTINTSGQLPSGEVFETAADLKSILVTSQRDVIVKNIVEKTLAYALCRELTVHDVPTVNTITADMLGREATWKDLFVAIAQSLPFQKYCPPAS